MAFENLDINGDQDTEDFENGAPPEESGNRTFLIIAAALGGVALLALICIAVYALVLLPRSRNAQQSAVTTLDAQNTEVAAIIDSTSTADAITREAASWTATPTVTPIPPTPTITSSPTPVVVVPTNTPLAAAQLITATATMDPILAKATELQATFSAAYTAAAISTQTAMPAQVTQQTGMPKTGFADEYGLPMLLGLAVLLVAIIFLARRLRTS